MIPHTASEIAQLIVTNPASAVEWVEESLRLAATSETHSMLPIERDTVLLEAHKQPRQHTNGPLAGVPVVIKDNIAQAGVPLRAGRRDGTVATHDALVVTRLKAAGAVVVGRANMDELAYGVTGTNVHHGQVFNPLRAGFHPGGSSAGSAAAVAEGIAPIALGSDTAGSIRIPASLCGLVGFRPTHGRVPSSGVAPLCPELDCVGPIARTVSDAALVYSIIADDPEILNDLQTSPAVQTVRWGVVRGRFAVEPTSEVLALFEGVIEHLSKVASCTDIIIDELADGPKASGPIIGAQASFAWQKELASHREWFGEEVAGHIEKGATILATRYLRAVSDANRVKNAVARAFDHHDVLILPTTATAAKAASDPGPQLTYLALTVPFSLGGNPSVSIPMGVVDGLPVGVQVVGRPDEDRTVLQVARAIELMLR